MTERKHHTRQLSVLWRIMSGRRVLYACAILAEVLSTAAMMVTPFIGQITIDSFIDKKPITAPGWIVGIIEYLGGSDYISQNLWIAGGSLVILAAVGGLFRYFRGIWAARASEDIARKTRNRLFGHLQKLPCTFHDRAEIGDLVQRCTSDVETVRMFLATHIVDTGHAALLIIFAIPLMLSLNGQMTLVSMALIPIIIIFAIFFFVKVRFAFRQSDEAEGAMTAALQENLTGIRVVRAFARQKFEKEKFARKNSAFRTKTYKMMRMMACYWPLSDILCHTQRGGVLFVGAYLVIGGTLTVGDMFAFFSWSQLILWPLQRFGRILGELGKTTVSLERIGDILDEKTEEQIDTERTTERISAKKFTEAKGEISFDRLTFFYGREHEHALHDVSFDVAPGQTLAILGPSGSGKSTIIHLLLRLYDYEHGSIRLDGRELRDLDRDDVRSQFGVVMQEPFLYSRTVRENIRLGHLHAADADVIRAAEDACMHHAIRSFEQGYDTIVGERGVTLSGGQRQRVALARAIVSDPPILMLDDALSAVDTRTEAMILEALSKRHGRRTTLVIAHRLSTLEHADRIIVLEHGTIVQDGTHESLLVQEGLYRRIWQVQRELQEELDREISNG